MNKIRDTKQWTAIINPGSGWFDIHLSSLWSYRDLVLLFVRRDFLAVYKQTILGPIWYLLQPLFTTLVFTVIFGKIARLPTDGLPPMIFYMSGIVAWRYFTDCLTKTSNTFAGNASIFGKVWFPRLAVPISVVISNLISFGIQFILFLGFWVYFIMNGAAISPKPLILLMPLFIIQMGALGLGFGIIASSLTTKYRDLAQLIGFGVQLWMYATPVIYPISMVPGKWQWLIALNPMAPIIEGFRYAFLGSGTIHPWQIGLSLGTTIVILAIGIILFSRIEKDFMDTV
jgi:lipopolysaccharide transport system permease protein